MFGGDSEMAGMLSGDEEMTAEAKKAMDNILGSIGMDSEKLEKALAEAEGEEMAKKAAASSEAVAPTPRDDGEIGGAKRPNARCRVIKGEDLDDDVLEVAIELPQIASIADVDLEVSESLLSLDG